MMEPADFGQFDNLTHRRGLDFSWVRSVFVQGEVRSRALVVADVGTEDATKMCLAQDGHEIVSFPCARMFRKATIRLMMPARPLRVGRTSAPPRR